MFVAQELASEREWHKTRTLMATILNTVSKDTISPKSIIELPLIDKESITLPIRSKDEAYALLKTFIVN